MAPAKVYSQKENWELINSILWFFMDVLWMLDHTDLAIAVGLPALLSGFLILFLEKQRETWWIDAAIFLWLVMNLTWLLHDVTEQPLFLLASKTAFACGLTTLIISLSISKDWTTALASFRRLRFRPTRPERPVLGRE